MVEDFSNQAQDLNLRWTTFNLSKSVCNSRTGVWLECVASGTYPERFDAGSPNSYILYTTFVQ